MVVVHPFWQYGFIAVAYFEIEKEIPRVGTGVSLLPQFKDKIIEE